MTCRRRHWYSYYGEPGTSSPMCVRRCGTLNPNYDESRDPEIKRNQRLNNPGYSM